MQVVGEHDSPRRGGRIPRLAFLVLGLLAAFVLITHRSAPVVPPPGPALEELVPGLRSTLLAVVGARRPYRVIRWEASRTAPETLLLPEDSGLPAFDASGGWVGSLVDTGPALRRLHLGPVDGEPAPVVEGITSFAWHGEEPARLAWTISPDGASAIVRARIDADGMRTEAPLPAPAGRLEAWGDWGFLLSVGDPPIVVLLDHRGSPRLRLPARLVAVRGDGMTLVGSSEQTELLDPQTGRLISLSWITRDPLAGAWSPDGEHLAVVVGGATPELAVHDLDGRPGLRRSVPALARPAWSPDGRFLALAIPELPPHGAQRPIFFLDLGSETLHMVRFPEPVQQATLR